MKLRGLSAEEVDKRVEAFAKLMRHGMKNSCALAAQQMTALTADASDGDVSFAVDSLGVLAEQWGVYTGEILMPALEKTAVEAGKAVVGPLGVVVPDVKMTQFLDTMHGWVTDFAGEMWDTAKTAIVTGAQDGASMGELATAVADVAQVKEKKAKVIAQTAVIAAINGGEWSQMTQAAEGWGLTIVKEWEATEDSHTRPTHHAADGQRVPLNEPFVVGNSHLMFPGDPIGSTEEVINCRCTTLYDSDIDEPITASQSSPEPLSLPTTVNPNGQKLADAILISMPKFEMKMSGPVSPELIEIMTGESLTAANNAAFNAMHPRGKDGKFIKKGTGLGEGVFDALTHAKKGGLWNELSEDEKQQFVDAAENLTPAQWHNLKDEDQEHIQGLADAALNDGLPGSGKAILHIEDLTTSPEPDFGTSIFNPNTPMPSATAIDAEKAKKQATELAIYDAYDHAKLTDDELQELLVTLDQHGADAANKQLAEMTSVGPGVSTVSTAPLTTGSSKPVKITHGLIHAKHTPGTIIAQSKDGDVRVKWNGSSYDIEAKTDQGWVGPSSMKNVKKSKLYALLHDKFQNTDWVSSGKQESEVTHAAPLHAAPPAAPIPHPTSGGTVTVGKKVDFANVAVGDQVISDGYAPYATVNGKVSMVAKIEKVKGDDGKTFIRLQDENGNPIASGFVGDKVNLHTPAPATTGPWGTLGDDVKAKITKAYFDNKIDEQQFSELTDALNNGSITGVEAEAQLNEYLGVSTPNVPSAPVVVAPPVVQTPSTPNVAKKLDMTGWKKVGGQGGHNLGGLFEAPDGTQYYVKSMKSQDAAKSEVLANALYAATGVNVPEVRHVGTGAPTGWKNVIASKIVPNAKMNANKLKNDAAFKKQIQSDFATDAWLANWDVVGSGDVKYSNIVDADGKPWRIDVGGALEYGGAGEKNTNKLSPNVVELTTMRSESMNKETAKVFGSMTDAEVKESAKKLLPLTDDKIDQLVKDAGMSQDLANKLKARRKFILDKFGLDGNNASTPAAFAEPELDYGSEGLDIVPSGGITVTTTMTEIPDSLPELSDFGNEQYKKTLKKWQDGTITKDQFDSLVDTIKQVYPSGSMVTTSFDDPKYDNMWDTVNLSDAQLAEVNKLYSQYNKGLMTKDEAYNELQAIKNNAPAGTGITMAHTLPNAVADVLDLPPSKISGIDYETLADDVNDNLEFDTWNALSDVDKDLLFNAVEFHAYGKNDSSDIAQALEKLHQFNDLETQANESKPKILLPEDIMDSFAGANPGDTLAYTTYTSPNTGKEQNLVLMKSPDGTALQMKNETNGTTKHWTQEQLNKATANYSLTWKDKPEAVAAPTAPTGAPSATPMTEVQIVDAFDNANVGDVLAITTTPGGASYELLKHSDTHFSAKNVDNGVESWLLFSELQKVTKDNNITWHTPDSYIPAPAVVPSAPATPAAPLHPSADDLIAMAKSYPENTQLATGVDKDGDTFTAWAHADPDNFVTVKMGDHGTPHSWTHEKLDTWTNNYKIKWTSSTSSPAPAAPATGATPSAAPIVTAADVTFAKKWTFFQHFKDEKVSPAWSASKIYTSMHTAKQKMSGDSQISSLSDDELLKLLDEVEKAKSGKNTAYSTKVKDWLKTPNGVKAFKQLNPAIPTTTPSVAKSVGKFAKKGAKKIAPSISTPTLTKDQALGSTTIDALMSDPDKLKVFNDFKASPYGKFLNSSKPEEIYWNAVQQSKNTPHSTPGSILAIVDEQGAKKLGVTNTKLFEEKVTNWLNTPSGGKKAAEIQAGTWAPSTATPSLSSYGGGSTTSHTFSKDLPLDQKVKNLTKNIEQFDPNKKYNPAKKHSGPPDNDFPVITGAKAAALWDKWEQDQGALTATQKSSLKAYTGNSFTPMNDYLRGYTGASQATQDKINQAQAGMKLSTEPLVFHRGNGWFTGWNSVAEIKAKPIGSDFPQEAFFSTSVSGKSAFSGPINFIIECPPGTPMAYVKGFSNYGHENEMLLGANITYKIMAIHEHDIDNSWHYNTKVTVVLRAIPHEDVV